ncbi:hypothetical protein J6590_028564 [Homalodisca vitripennis]|nr:hypothetical protein J6590_028564 [Homalodisca vitripennis]
MSDSEPQPNLRRCHVKTSRNCAVEGILCNMVSSLEHVLLVRWAIAAEFSLILFNSSDESISTVKDSSQKYEVCNPPTRIRGLLGSVHAFDCVHNGNLLRERCYNVTTHVD